VSVTYCDQPINGSPFYVEVYDPNKIRVEGGHQGIVGEKFNFDG